MRDHTNYFRLIGMVPEAGLLKIILYSKLSQRRWVATCILL